MNEHLTPFRHIPHTYNSKNPSAQESAHLEDEVVLENKIGDAGYKNEKGRKDCSPQEDDAIWLRQLHQVGELETGDVIK